MHSVQACRVSRVAAQSITDNSITTVNFDDEIFDTAGMHSTSVSNSRITINTAGIYIVGFTGHFASGNDYARTLGILLLNGTTDIARAQNTGTAVTVQQYINLNTVYQFDVADYVEVQVYQDNTASAARNLEVRADRSPQLSAARIGS